MQHLDKFRGKVIDNLAASPIERRNFFHILVRKGKIEDVEILPHALLMHALGDDARAALQAPAQGDLRRALAVLPSGRDG